MLQLLLDRSVLGTYDYGRAITFKIYDENDNPFNATGYTATAKIFDTEWGRLAMGDYAYVIGYGYSGQGYLTGLGYGTSPADQIIPDITCSWTSQSTGQGSFSLDSTRNFSTSGQFYIAIQLTKAGTVESTRRAMVYVLATPGPATNP